jgi:hypothetical protein
MLKGAIEHPGEDFHVAMGVHAETLTRGDDVFIDDAKMTEAHVLGVVILVERKSEMGIEPAVMVVAAFVAGPNGNHVIIPLVTI